MPEQPTDYKSHIKMLDQHLKANRNNTLELYKWYNTKWSPEMYFTDFETKCSEQALYCNLPITLDNAIIMMTVVKTSNVELGNETITNNGVLKLVRETVKAFEIASKGRQMMKSGEEVNRSYSEEGKGPLLPVLGKFTATLTREEIEIAEAVYVVKGQGDTALLSSGAAERMCLVEYHLT